MHKCSKYYVYEQYIKNYILDLESFLDFESCDHSQYLRTWSKVLHYTLLITYKSSVQYCALTD